MDILKAELERKKRQLQSNSDIMAPNKKYFKRGDLAAKQEEEYWKKHKKLVPDKVIDPALTEMDGDKPSSSEDSEKVMLHRKEVIRRLREFNEPILLFGESEYDAFVRLKKLESAEPDFSKGSGAGSNDFKAAMDKVDQEYYAEIMNSTDNSELGTKKRETVSVKDDGTTLEDIEKWKNELGQGDSERDQEIILRYLKFVLTTWGNDINQKLDSEKRSLKGKMNAAMHQQTVSYMKPMFRQLKNKKMQEDILECLVQILGHLLERDYIKANDAYLEMAIGNAPWPIGVTMVGIHARTGREKISSRYVAHVLNDETQRKYIQGLKRIMTQAQVFFPTDPSRSVNFEPIHH